MNKIIASASLVTLGVASLNAAYAPGLTPAQSSKPWNVSAVLRGFYDDNYTTLPYYSAQETFGIEVRPSVGLNLVLDQTTIGLTYTYGLKYYEDSDEVDHAHDVALKVSHAFSEQTKFDLTDTFSIAQEPQIDDPVFATPLRTESDYIRNVARASLSLQTTELLGFELAYANYFYDYDGEGLGSYSALLDRLEHYFTLDSRWTVSPTTIGVVGYRYSITDYTSDDDIIAGTPADSRDSTSHYAYVGADQTFNPNLTGSVRLGAQFVDYDSGGDDTSPYVDASLTYRYLPGSSFQLGARHQHSSTDVAARDQQATSIYASINHRITSNLTGTLYGRYQKSDFDNTIVGGVGSGFTEDFQSLSAYLSYKLTEFVSLEGGYTYDHLDSDNPARSYERNRVYAGVRAAF